MPLAAALALSSAQSIGEDGPSSAAPAPAPEVQPAPPAAPPPAAPLTRADAEAWLDGFMPYALASGDIAGAVVVIVKDGAVLVQKGYGYSDVAEQKPVDPERTLFRPGSVSKLFTWTAVMQQVEQGNLDLDADINTYLDFEIPAREGKPITLRNVLTHTPGFEEQIKNLMLKEGDALDALDVHLKRWSPERIFEAGVMPAYSNYATALAGYVVARVSGLSFDDYIEKHIFEPLGMEYSTFRQPLPERLKPHMSKGYVVASLPPKPFELVGPAPAGSLSASGADMARFMIAHLQKGGEGEARILNAATAEQMHTTALTILPRVNRMALGFYETNYNGRRAIAHAGDTIAFHSDLHLFIDDGVGIYISMNSAGKDGAAGRVRSALFEDFTDRYLPGPAPEGQVDAATAAEHARMIAGRYINSRRASSSFFSLLNLIGEVKVIPNDDATVSVSMVTSPSGVPLKWREIEPFVWRQVGGEQLMSAEVRDDRVVRFTFEPLSPFMMFERSPAATSGGWLLPVLVAALLAALFTVIAWPAAALTRRHYRVAYPLSGENAKAHRWVRFSALAVIVLCIAWGATITAMMSDFSLLTPKLDGWVWVLQLLSPIVFFGAAAFGIWNAWVVLRSGRSWYAKLWAIALAISFLAVLWVALAYHLIAFDVNY